MSIELNFLQIRPAVVCGDRLLKQSDRDRVLNYSDASPPFVLQTVVELRIEDTKLAIRDSRLIRFAKTIPNPTAPRA